MSPNGVRVEASFDRREFPRYAPLSRRGRTPARQEWLSAGPRRPCARTIAEHFGSWEAGLVAAGLLDVSTPGRPDREGLAPGLRSGPAPRTSARNGPPPLTRIEAHHGLESSDHAAQRSEGHRSTA